jgi:DNA helicase-2/ATP-dependent DNA helicase PcrA
VLPLQVFEEGDFVRDFHLTQTQLDEFEKRLVEGGFDARERLKAFTPVADEFQNTVIDSRDHTIRVVAPAGSGKTQTVVNRAIKRIQGGLRASRILILTFDNSASNSLSSKFQNLQEQEGITIEIPEIRTLNSFGLAILREFAPREAKDIADGRMQNRVIKEILDELRRTSAERHNLLPQKISYRYYREYLSLLKNQLFDPRNFSAQILADYIFENEKSFLFFSLANSEEKKKLVIQSLMWIFQKQETTYQKYRVMDFDDQKLRAYVLASNSSSLASSIQAKYSEVIVDEFQDINKLDFELIKLISNESDLIVVGDDDQAIYGFRGCSPEYIINFERHIGRSVSSFELSKNYRCPQNIVHHADKLIQHNNPNRIEKLPIAQIDSVASIKIVFAPSPINEAKQIIAYINSLLREKRRQLGEDFGFENFAVLYRTNAQSFPLQLEMILHGIPFHVRKSDSILNNAVLEKILAILQVKLDMERKQPSSVENCISLLEGYFKNIYPEDRQNLQTFFSRQTLFLDKAMSSSFSKILPKAANSNFLFALRELLQANGLDKAMDAITKNFNNLYGLVGSLEDIVEDKVPLAEIFDIASSFKGDIEGFIQSISGTIAKAKLSNAGNNEESGVSLRTYFRAKGLQWDTVILTTCNEGLIPHSKAKVEEERRLFYVAITRASSNLYISYVKNVAKESVHPSRFIVEGGFR